MRTASRPALRAPPIDTVATGTPAEVRAHREVVDAYLGR